MIVGRLKVAGILPIAVTTKLKLKVVSTFELNSTLLMLTILASVSTMEYYDNLQSGLL